MADERSYDTLQEEIKLMKGELKQSLASVRDYLLNMELPSSEISNILSELGDESQKVTMKGILDVPKQGKSQAEAADTVTETEESLTDHNIPDEGDDLLDLEEKPEEEEEESLGPEDNFLSGDDGYSEDEEQPFSESGNAPAENKAPQPKGSRPAPEENYEYMPEEEQPFKPEMFSDEDLPTQEEQPLEEEQPMQYDKLSEDVSMSVPKVNMLANLINWVAKANREIGREQIPTFLEVYGISGFLSPELKEVIIHLSEITGEDSEITSNSEIWSQSMLLLHGILTGGDAPVHPIMPAWKADEKAVLEEEIIEVDKAKDKSIKLKLVLPDEEGEEKEFCINLSPEADGDKG